MKHEFCRVYQPNQIPYSIGATSSIQGHAPNLPISPVQVGIMDIKYLIGTFAWAKPTVCPSRCKTVSWICFFRFVYNHANVSKSVHIHECIVGLVQPQSLCFTVIAWLSKWNTSNKKNNPWELSRGIRTQNWVYAYFFNCWSHLSFMGEVAHRLPELKSKFPLLSIYRLLHCQHGSKHCSTPMHK